MKTGWILVFFVISLFFISGQAGCATLQTQPGGGSIGQGIPSGISTISGGNGLNINIEPIGNDLQHPGVIYEGDEFAIYLHLINKGKAIEPKIKIWDVNNDLGAIPPGEELSISLEDARTGNRIEEKKEDITFGPYKYINLKSDVNTHIIVDTSVDYSVSITPPTAICIAKKESTLCESGESISNLGDEAAAVPITVTGITKSYRTIEDRVNLVLGISLSDKGQGAGLNDYVNNFRVSLEEGTVLKCKIDGAAVGNTINVKQLKTPIQCTAQLSLEGEESSSQVTISFDYNYLIRQSIPVSVKAIKKEYLT